MEIEAMHQREITLPDGRYMVFYTFGDEGLGADPGSELDAIEEERTSPSAEAPATPPS